MESFVKKLSYFNLSACLLYLVLAKLHHDWLSFIVLLFPLVFNWKVLQGLKTKRLRWDVWNYFAAATTLAYVAFSTTFIVKRISGSSAQERTMFILLGIEAVCSAALLLHFLLAVKMSANYMRTKN